MGTRGDLLLPPTPPAGTGDLAARPLARGLAGSGECPGLGGVNQSQSNPAPRLLFSITRNKQMRLTWISHFRSGGQSQSHCTQFPPSLNEKLGKPHIFFGEGEVSPLPLSLVFKFHKPRRDMSRALCSWRANISALPNKQKMTQFFSFPLFPKPKHPKKLDGKWKPQIDFTYPDRAGETSPASPALTQVWWQHVLPGVSFPVSKEQERLWGWPQLKSHVAYELLQKAAIPCPTPRALVLFAPRFVGQTISQTAAGGMLARWLQGASQGCAPAPRPQAVPASQLDAPLLPPGNGSGRRNPPFPRYFFPRSFFLNYVKGICMVPTSQGYQALPRQGGSLPRDAPRQPCSQY